ncbi:type I pullulanase [Kosmotoga pacifica]|uniref:type I pullulanase n=1 Tax=Kosmotoga pacifica TaxID=1330330 RepID=UPI000699D50C|nr:type I pullulanase [Kosmotoga pacifica]
MTGFATVESSDTLILYSNVPPAKLFINGVEAAFTPLFQEVNWKLRLNESKLDPFSNIEIILKNNEKVFAYPVGILEDERYSYSKPLGYKIDENGTHFKLWAPGPGEISIEVFSPNDLKKPVYTLPTFLQPNGLRIAKLEKSLAGYAYRFKIERYGETLYTVDPYAPFSMVNGEYSYIYNLDEATPENWISDKGPVLKDAVDAIVYELHIKDFSSSWTAGSEFPGKYRAFYEESYSPPLNINTCLSHLVELGITHVHLLPVHDFNSVDEEDPYQYNWGYDPALFFVPEGSYATSPCDPVNRVLEFRRLVQKLHQNNLGVVLDVVFNHTYGEDTPFQKLVPYYYYRLTPEGAFSNGSGCGNELATERPMVRHYIINALKHWVENYHVDGFRFDLMALLGKEMMLIIEKELKRIKKDILLYGEPWAAAQTIMRDTPIIKGEQKGTGIAVFNDEIRNALKGYPDDGTRGFVSGEFTKRTEVMKGIVAEIEFSEELSGFASEPSEVVNYVSAHDNLTLIDKFHKSCPDEKFENKAKMAALALAIVLTSQGIPFLHAGSEMLRTKLLEENSYKSGTLINEINYNQKYIYTDFYNYIRGLIELRKKERLFRLKSSEEIRKKLKFLPTRSSAVIAFILHDEEKEIFVAHNASKKPQKVLLDSDASWEILVTDCKINWQGFGKVSRVIPVEAISTTIAIKRAGGK